MPRDRDTPDLPWIEPGDPLPPVATAWGPQSPAPGLLAAGHDLTATRLLESYSQGIFPWFSQGQPVLWWSPDPRMVLHVEDFRLRKSLRQSLKRWLRHPGFELRFDHAFSQVIHRCAGAPRPGQNGTWIVPEMVAAYEFLHSQGHAHSAEVWLDGQLVAGLYFVALGHAIFGESMFTTIADGSKMALTCLVSVCLQHQMPAIDCQQNTSHLASLGAREISRTEFLALVNQERQHPNINWATQSLNWQALARLESTP